jgi:hypothetical protein
MSYRLLADLAVVVHFLWILFLIFGALAGRRHKVVKVIHLAGLLFAVILHVFSLTCPLTYAEIYFTKLADSAAAYSGSFIIHYVDRLVYIALPPGFLLALTVALALFNGLIYFGRK